MPRTRPSTSGYARIEQAEEQQEEDLDESDNEDPRSTAPSLASSGPSYAPIQPGRLARMHSYQPKSDSNTFLLGGPSHRRNRSSSAVDIKAINARLEKWAEEIAAKFKIRKIKGKSTDEEKLEIHYSVFQAPEHTRPATAEELAARGSEHAAGRMTKIEFDDIVESVKVAIELGVHPKMISQGSSGSYFAQNSDGKVVGVFKPKDEEPYASRNPKWTKWIHRNLFPFFFGRACLIPNLSYVSEAAAYVLDTRLQTNMVPYTDIVYLSSKSFFYDFWERRAFYRNRKPFAQKVGSFQVFLKGFQDANVFLKKHPWPDQATSHLRYDSAERHKQRRWADECRPGRVSSDDEYEEDVPTRGRAESSRRRGFWSETLQQSLREELEKLVILDYIMRNTDRGLDNWMIRVDEDTGKASIVADMPRQANGNTTNGDGSSDPYKREEPMTTTGASKPSKAPLGPKITLGAIDNSLSWPWKHPDAWRSFPFGWLFLPVSLIGQPFSDKTRKHFLPLLTSKQWWSETQVALRNCFMQDSDFQERMFARQIAVMKGQAWNVVETLKTSDHGPLELTRRARVCVWDDLVDIPVAMPMRASLDQVRHQRKPDMSKSNQGQELDISAALDSAVEAEHPMVDLRSRTDHATSPNQFNRSRQGSPESAQKPNEEDDITSQAAMNDETSAVLANPKKREIPEYLKHIRPTSQRSQTRLSYDEPRRRWLDEDAGKRNFSFSARRLDSEDDGMEGDLGFAAARNMEGSRRKVIVERLETVKSKSPVFTWC